jgi:hypothetical protein
LLWINLRESSFLQVNVQHHELTALQPWVA